MLRETPATLLATSPEEFDRAVEANMRDSSRQWQLDVLGRVCSDHLLVRLSPSLACALDVMIVVTHSSTSPAPTLHACDWLQELEIEIAEAVSGKVDTSLQR